SPAGGITGAPHAEEIGSESSCLASETNADARCRPTPPGLCAARVLSREACGRRACGRRVQHKRTSHQRLNVKICSIVGARPQFVKAGVVSREIRRHTEIEEVVVHTGQHYDFNMSELFFRECELPEPRYNLGVGSGPHGAQTARMLEMLEQ